MRAYEVMVILDPSLDERTIEPSLDKYLNVIRKDGGSIESLDVWGRRRMAYEIKKNAEGIYAVIHADGRARDGQGVRPPAHAERVDPAHEGHASRRPLIALRACGKPFPLSVSACLMGSITESNPDQPAQQQDFLRRPDMAGETTITVIGNLVDDPELRFTPSGAPVANFRIASTPRTFDRQSNEWKDGDTLFLSCAVWRQAAENVAESLQRGMRVIVQGRLKSRQYETREGEKRTVFEIDVEEVGPSLRSASAKVTKTTRSGGGGGYSGGGGGGGYSGGGGQQSAPADDPWASPAPAQGGGGGRLGRSAPGRQPQGGGQPARCAERPVGHARGLRRRHRRAALLSDPEHIEHHTPFRP